MKQEIKTTTVTQSGSKELGTTEKKLHYLIIGEGDDKIIISIGEKNKNAIDKLITKK